jgi:pimeloyl-ACP methyl ester carboxylesterase
MSRTTRLALAAATAALMFAPVGAAAASAHGPSAPPAAARYCARYDAYELHDCAPAHRLPGGPLGRQLGWVLDNLSGGTATLTLDEVRAHLTPGLQQVQPAEAVLDGFRSTLAERGPMRLVGFSYPPRSEQALAIVRSTSGEPGAVAVGTDGALIDAIGLDQAPPTLVPRGRYNGWFDVGGRRLFLRCTGFGGPTVVFDNGLTADWYDLQNRLSALTRVCSYDPARQGGPLGRSDSAPGPRTGVDRVRDLHALLAAAHVPGPYVLAGHSNGALFSLLYASRHPQQVAGMVLIDGVHPDYHRRSIEVAKHFVPHDLWDELVEAACGIPPVQVDAELMDICRAEAQTRAALAAHPLHRMPLAVITHGGLHFPPGSEAAAQERLWQQLQDELAAMQPGSTHIIATRSGHDIQHEQPELVLAQLRRVVTAVRAS